MPLPAGAPVVSSTVLGEDALRGPCARAPAPECVYALSVPVRSEVRLALESVDFDGSLSLLGANAAVELACSDDAPPGDAHHSRLDLTLERGEYLVVVDGAPGEAGEFELFAALEPLPEAAGVCASAEPISAGLSVRGSTRGAANTFAATCAAGAQGPDHVYRFDVRAASRVRARQQTEHDGALSLRARCEDPASELACGDGSFDDSRASLTAKVVPGTYYLVTDSSAPSQSGDYALHLEVAPEPPARSLEERCRSLGVRTYAPGEYELDTLYESSSTLGSCGGQDAPEHLLAFDVRQTSVLVAVLDDPELDAVLYVRRGCADPSSELACAPALRPAPNALTGERVPGELRARLTPGRYTLVVDGLGPADMGAARVRFSLEAT